MRCSKTTRYQRNEANVFESDLPISSRVLSDIYLREDDISTGHRVIFFDIEVSTVGGFPDMEMADKAITSISLYDATTEEYHVFVFDPKDDRDNFSKDGVFVKFFREEFDLLYKFVDLWEGINPTIISGWHSDRFDVPYLYRRLRNVVGTANANRLSCIGKVKFSSYMQRYQIAGISSLDYLELYKKFTYNELPNYRLDTVGRLELGIGKIEYEGTLDELYEEDLDEFIRYNKRDVEILVGLDNKLKLIDLVRGICHIGHVPYEDYSYTSRWLEGTIVTYLHRKGLVVTDKDPLGRTKMDDSPSDNFAGAYVKVPHPAKYDWVYSLDLQSLYPSIIMSLNISPETKMGKVNGWSPARWETNDKLVFETYHDNKAHNLTVQQLREVIDEGNLSISSNGIVYRNDKVGVIPEILDMWFKDRVKYKKLLNEYTESGDEEQAEYYDRRQHIQKIFLNSLYGVLGLPIFRFFDIDNALAVTATGQDVIKQSEIFVNDVYKLHGAPPKTKVEVKKYHLELIKDAKKKKIKVSPPIPSADDWCIYIDTDSLYFSSLPLAHKQEESGLDTLNFTIKFAGMLEGRLNTMYDKMAKDMFNCYDHRFHIKGETISSSAIWIAKKRYAYLSVYDLEKGIPVDSKMKAKGLDIVRSTFPIVFKTYMQQFIKDILAGSTKEEINRGMMEWYKKLSQCAYREVARNTSASDVFKYTVSDAPFNEYVKGAPMHIKACINYNRFLEERDLEEMYPRIGDGEKIKYVMLKDNPYRIPHIAFKDDGDPPEIIKFIETYHDNNKMFDKEMRKKLDGFYYALDWGQLPMDSKVDNDVLNMFGLSS